MRVGSTAVSAVLLSAACLGALAGWSRRLMRSPQLGERYEDPGLRGGLVDPLAREGITGARILQRVRRPADEMELVSGVEVPPMPYQDEPTFLRLARRPPVTDGTNPHASYHLGALLPAHISPPEPPQVPPYLALFEYHNATEGRVMRDAVGGGYDGFMGWRQLREASPRITYVHDFWTPAEAEAIRKLAEPYVKRSEVVSKHEQDSVNRVRTSFGMFLSSAEHRAHPVVIAGTRRASRVSLLPVENIEAIQVLHYDPGQEYRAHPDYFERQYKEHLNRGGQRVATVFTWLNEPRDGGETFFPKAGAGVAVKPKQCDAVVFYSCHQEEDEAGLCKEDPASFHAALPPAPGNEKWAAVFWIRQRAFK
eukprot:TRINITY_DN7793_c0_g1_i1.p1 TRINITY_DN7793_c0_g1~~TRINITY_DN7793_c0_g1_i1.p1  ORF type:complete len:366 (+),score=83.14 TRINITY_DN7793_c0_g1_i1:131-1228(+)